MAYTRVLSKGALVLLLVGVSQCFANVEPSEKVAVVKNKHAANIVFDTVKKKDPLAGKKPKFVGQFGDMKASLKGETKVENYFAKNMVMLNSGIPDEHGYWRQIFDLKGGVAWGEKEFGFPALEVFANVRQKAMWGDVGKSVETIKTTINVDGTNVSLGNHGHKADKALVWLREGWMQLSWNAAIDKREGTQHYIKMGLFKFELGRGISLGSIYGASREYLGIYTGYQNDVCAPGINIHGEFIPNKLTYDFYYAKLEEKSASIRDTFNTLKANHVGRSLNPWRGVNKDNDLFAARLQWKALNDHRATIDIEPYVLYNIADDRFLEIEADSQFKLGTFGLMFEYKGSNFEWGFESAFNIGRQKAVHLDRNNFNFAIDASGNVTRQFSHIVTAANTSASSGTKVAATSANITTVNASSSTINGEQIATGLFSASDRFRPGFKVDFRGWMGVFDAAYTFHKADVKLSFASGIASGDRNPFYTATNGTYEGFVGLQEGYSGSRVPSVLVLDARKLKRPLSIDVDTERASGEDSSFTDMIFTGGGLSWFPIYHDSDKFNLSSNMLLFWKYKESPKYDATTEAFLANTEARKYLGTEFNLRAKYEVLADLAFSADIAVFLPGTYYSDTKGQPLRDDIAKRINKQNEKGINAQFRLGTDNAYYFNFGLKYKF